VKTFQDMSQTDNDVLCLASRKHTLDSDRLCLPFVSSTLICSLE